MTASAMIFRVVVAALGPSTSIHQSLLGPDSHREQAWTWQGVDSYQ